MRNLMLKAYVKARHGSLQKEEGQGTVEYALIIGAVVVVLVGILATAGEDWIDSVTANVSDALDI